MQQFKDAFKTAAVGQFGSGWALAGAGHRRQAEGHQDAERLEPAGHRRRQALLGCDVWEHSYYLDFRNRRPDYVQNWLDKLANYEFAEAELKASGSDLDPAGAEPLDLALRASGPAGRGRAPGLQSLRRLGVVGRASA